MKKIRLIVSVLLLTVLCGCAKISGSETLQGNADGGNGGEPSVELKMLLYAFGGSVADANLVEQELNAYIEPKIGARVDMEFINVGSWNEQINLRICGGQQIDLMPTFGAEIASLYTQEALLPLDELIRAYGQGIVEEVGAPYIDAGKINGQLYSIVTEHEFAANKVFLYRKDIADKYGLDFGSVKELADLEPLLKVIKENEPDMAPMCSGGAGTLSFLNNFNWDMIGTGGVILDPANSLTVENLYASEQYRELVTLMHRWYEEGYIAKDAATSTVGYSELFDSGKAFGCIAGSKPGFVEQEERKISKPLAEVELVPTITTTSGITIANWVIPTVCAYPEKAMQLLNLMYTDPVVANLLAYGIEGVHYEMVDKENDVAGYVEGQNYASCGYAPSLGWILGGQFITHVWEGNAPDIWEQTRNFNNTAIVSKALGFNFDHAPVQNERTAVNNVIHKYAAGLEAGALDPAEELDKFIEELKSAGIDTIIAEQQRQLDAWAASVSER